MRFEIYRIDGGWRMGLQKRLMSGGAPRLISKISKKIEVFQVLSERGNVAVISRISRVRLYVTPQMEAH